MDDEEGMRYAIRLAQRAEEAGEVPVGALLVKDNEVIAEGWNRPISEFDPTAHAEIIAIRRAGQVLKNYRLLNTTLYVTLEPCLMCIGAICQSRIQRLVFGAYDVKRGAVCHAFTLAEANFLNHKIEWEGGVLETDTAYLLRDFFRRKRLLNANKK
ncbi:MAG: tRNA adenosine(34) deaminase TadA [Methylococcales bacterium]|nr:tRNA adenosine(34) deaminase TadA [Methylococcales bacterium]